MLEHRMRFARAISPGHRGAVRDVGVVRCQRCGRQDQVVIQEATARRCPPTALAPHEALHAQAILAGWVVAIAQVRAGNRLLDWDLTLCPECADQALQEALEALADGCGTRPAQGQFRGGFPRGRSRRGTHGPARSL